MTAAHGDSFFAVHREHVLVGLAVWFVVVFASVVLNKRSATVAGDPVASRWVWLAAAASVVGAVIHLAVTKEHFGESILYGSFFLALGVAQLAWSALVVVRPGSVIVTAGAVSSVAVVVLWLVTRTIAIPLGPAAGTTEPFGVEDALCSLAECVVAVACAVLLSARLRPMSAVPTGSAPPPPNVRVR